MKKAVDLEGQVYLPTMETVLEAQVRAKTLANANSPETWGQAYIMRCALRKLNRELAQARRRQRREAGAK